MPRAFSFVHGAINVFAVAVMGIYLSLQPSLYREWLIALFPPIHRDLVRDVLSDLGTTLRAWLVAQLFAMFEHNLLALGRYDPGPYPGRIELFRASDSVARKPDPGWTGLAQGGLAVHEIPGDHFSIVRSPERWAERLRIFLER